MIFMFGDATSRARTGGTSYRPTSTEPLLWRGQVIWVAGPSERGSLTARRLSVTMLRMPHQSTEPAICAIRMPVWQWRMVDRVLDNVVNVEAEKGDPHGLMEAGVQILQEGWRQMSGSTADTTGSTDWPHGDQEVTRSLSGTQWTYVISCLDRWCHVERAAGASSATDLLLIREIVVGQAEACLR